MYDKSKVRKDEQVAIKTRRHGGVVVSVVASQLEVQGHVMAVDQTKGQNKQAETGIMTSKAWLTDGEKKTTN